MYARGPLWTLQLAAVLAIASASSIRSNRIFERQDTCAADFTKCTQTGLPANFCCSTGSTCTVLAGGTTVLCCPKGGDCSTIQTISCTLSLQDPAKNPTAQVKTTELKGKLPTCGKGCCPFGYHCEDANGDCIMDADQSKKPGQTSSVSSPTATPSTHTASAGTASATKSATAETTSTATTSTPAQSEAPATSTEASSSTAKKTLNTAAIVGGVVGGLLALSLLIAGVCIFRHKRKKGDAEREKRDTTQSFGNIVTRENISAPIPHEDYYTQRLDFLAKSQGSNASTSSSPTHPHSHHDHFGPHSPYSASVFNRPHSGMTTFTDIDRPRSHHASAEIGGLRNLTDRYSAGSNANPFTPRGEHFHSGGSQSINIFADPSTVGSPSEYNPRNTTWTEFQHHADHPDTPLPPPRL
ncbi:hypothetical protein F5Y10DRAFT_189145 [Nemania abortiva]|nr:hypothetical protein F5Y10DRAFT_189145 [Nemania abortiva]